MKRIAVITGASSGIGREFVRRLDSAGLDEIWVIARRENRLEQLRTETATRLRVLPIDLADDAGVAAYAELLRREAPSVRYLVNAAGFGRFGRWDRVPPHDNQAMIRLNAAALVAVTQETLPFMYMGGKVLQLGSLSAFQPVPGMHVYAATKAFVLSYSRALNAELRSRGITVTAVCPGWVDTEFFTRADRTNDGSVGYYNKIYSPGEIVDTALRDSAKNRDLSVHGLPVRAQILAVKLLPARLVMLLWRLQQKYLDGYGEKPAALRDFITRKEYIFRKIFTEPQKK